MRKIYILLLELCYNSRKIPLIHEDEKEKDMHMIKLRNMDKLSFSLNKKEKVIKLRRR